jgi:hypothetical protein
MHPPEMTVAEIHGPYQLDADSRLSIQGKTWLSVWFRIVLMSTILFSELPARAQTSNTQLWVEYMLNVPFANVFNFENTFMYSTLFNTPRWRSLEYSPTLAYSLTQNIDLTLGATISYTAQFEDYNTLEIRPIFGSRIHITPNRRVLLRLYARIEQRNFLNLETDEWDHVMRPRIRAESVIPINRKTYFEDRLWYGVFDVELLFTNEDVDERFANRFRGRIGVGYRINYTSRFEFLYMNQQSRSGINDDFSSSDNIFRIRYKHYLRKHKPTKISGTGN